MKPIGIAIHIAKSGQLIIKTKKDVRPGSFIFDEKGKKIARVQETIGPTKSPYVSAVLVDDRAKRVIGRSVYT